MANPTLLDIAKANGSDAVVGLVDETTKAHPEISLGAARTVKGIQFKTLVRIALPSVGFRLANEGVVAGKGVYEKEGTREGLRPRGAILAALRHSQRRSDLPDVSLTSSRLATPRQAGGVARMRRFCRSC